MNENITKIAFLSPAIAQGGASRSLFHLIDGVKKAKPNWKLHLFINRCDSLQLKKEFLKLVESIEIVNIPEYKSATSQTEKENMQGVNYENTKHINIKQFANKINSLNIDILHINNSLFSFAYNIISNNTNVKVITHIREWIHWNGIHEKQKFIINQIKKYSDAIVCISDKEAEVFKDHPSLKILANPFDFEKIQNVGNKINKKDCLIIGNMASFTWTKGVIDFAKAIRYIEKNYSNLPKRKYIFLGSSPFNLITAFKTILKRLLGKKTVFYEVYKNIWWYYLKNKVEIIPPKENVYDYLNSFDIAVRTSSRGDPWGRNIIEYMALKKPVIATGESEFLIKDGETGYLVETGNIKMISEKIAYLMSNKSLIKQMGENGYKRIYYISNMNKFINSILEIYKKLLYLN
jgi:glycosyltransferase involved in cell wall biosynthesis